MRLIDKPLPDSTAQMLEYAQSGRLVPGCGNKHSRSLIGLCVFAGGAIGTGLLLGLLGLLVVGQPLATLGGALLLLIGLTVLAPTVRLLRESMSTVIPVRPGAVVPPEMVKKGCWIHRHGGWVRIEQVGRGGGGSITALISTGEVIDVRTPVTIAGDAFRPVHDAVASVHP